MSLKDYAHRRQQLTSLAHEIKINGPIKVYAPLGRYYGAEAPKREYDRTEITLTPADKVAFTAKEILQDQRDANARNRAHLKEIQELLDDEDGLLQQVDPGTLPYPRNDIDTLKARLAAIHHETHQQDLQGSPFASALPGAGSGPLSRSMATHNSAIHNSSNVAMQMQYWKLKDQDYEPHLKPLLEGSAATKASIPVLSEREIRQRNTARLKEQIAHLSQTTTPDWQFEEHPVWSAKMPPMFSNCEIGGVRHPIRGDPNLPGHSPGFMEESPCEEKVQLRGDSYRHRGWYNEIPDVSAALPADAPKKLVNLPNFGLIELPEAEIVKARSLAKAE